jgi:hypothetical protein
MNATAFRDHFNRLPLMLRFVAVIGVWLPLHSLSSTLANLALAAFVGWYFRGYLLVLALFVIAAFLVYATFSQHSVGTTRHRMTFDVEANGQVKSASSIIEIEYFWTASTTGSPLISRWRRGVAAVVDLGPNGMLVAAMGPDWSEWRRRKKQLGLSCSKPAYTWEMFDAAFGLDFGKPSNNSERKEFVAKAQKVPPGKMKLGADHLPAFIWFPNGASYREAQQLCPEEFSRVIGADVKLQAVTIEIAPDAPVARSLEIQAPWLNEIRSDKNNGSWSGSGDKPYWPRLPAQIESCPPGYTPSNCPGWAG